MSSKRKRTEYHNALKDRALQAIISKLDRSPTDADINLQDIPPDLMDSVNTEIFGATEEGAEDLSELSDCGKGVKRRKRRKRRKCKQSAFDDSGNVTPHKVKRIRREMESKICEAQINCSVFPDFDFMKAAASNPRLPELPSDIIEWRDNICRSGKSRDGVTVVHYLPKSVPQGTIDILNDKILHYATIVKPHRKTKTSPKKKGRYVDREGEITGEVRIVKGWHGLGQAGLEKVVPTSEFIGTGKAFNATSQLVKDLAILSHRVNATIEFMDPQHYEEVKLVHQELCRRIPSYKALCAIDPLMYESREVIFNRESGLHTDSQDPHLAWAILVAAGDFKGGGDVFFPHLGLRVRLLPGDMIALRGRVVPHQIDGWTGGQRISIPHFTHSSVWRTLGKDSVFV